jgi:hypothetical protein
MYAYIYIYIYTYMYLYVCIYMHTHSRMRTSAAMTYETIQLFMHAYIHTYIHACARTYIHTHILVYIHVQPWHMGSFSHSWHHFSLSEKSNTSRFVYMYACKFLCVYLLIFVCMYIRMQGNDDDLYVHMGIVCVMSVCTYVCMRVMYVCTYVHRPTTSDCHSHNNWGPTKRLLTVFSTSLPLENRWKTWNWLSIIMRMAVWTLIIATLLFTQHTYLYIYIYIYIYMVSV